jgi:DNA-binding response OmpR family regulator
MNILIVDDSDLLQNRLKKSLTELNKNINISLASNCQEAMDLFTHQPYDTIILDIDLPDGSGVQLLRLFKKKKPETDVIMFTNYQSAEFKKNCIELGADHFFNKSEIASLLKVISCISNPFHIT